MSPCLCLSLLPLSPTSVIFPSSNWGEARKCRYCLLITVSATGCWWGKLYCFFLTLACPNRQPHFLCVVFDQNTHTIHHPFLCSAAAQAQSSNPFDYNAWDLCALLPLQISCCIKSGPTASVVLASLKLHEKTLCINSNDLTLKKLRCSSVFNNILV